MHRTWILLAVVPLTTLAAGCCMCDAPYDYCGPTFLARPGEECCSDVRMNSAFTPYPAYVAAPVDAVIEGVPSAAPAAPVEDSPSDAPRSLSPEPAAPETRSTDPSVSTPPARDGETTTLAPRARPISFRR